MAAKEIKFKEPPLIEIVFQIVFPTIDGFGPAHIGIFWTQLRDAFPTIQAAARVGLLTNLNVGSGTFPDNRVWLVHKDSSQVIQIQDDRFMFNWRKTGESDGYPGFETLYPIFLDYFGRFVEFLDGEDLCPASATGFELTYINHIYEGVWEKWDDIGAVFPAFDWTDNPAKMPPLKGLRQFAHCDLPDNEGELSITIDSRTHKQTQQKLINYEIKVTGSERDIALDSLDNVFLRAHERLVQTLVAMTSRAAQKSWKRQ